MNYLTVNTNGRDLDAVIATTIGGGTLSNVVPLHQKGFYLILWT